MAAASAFCALSAAVFVLAAWFLNPLCLALSPLALAIVLGYSFTKRLSALSHLVLGLGLAIAPVGAWIAVTGRFAATPVVLGLSVLFWVAGFDVIYSLQDEAFDRAHGLFSLPARLGARRALDLSTVFHAVSLALLYGVFVLAQGGGPSSAPASSSRASSSSASTSSSRRRTSRAWTARSSRRTAGCRSRSSSAAPATSSSGD